MKRYYLSQHLPETTNSENLKPDIKQKLNEYKQDQIEVRNEAPQIRPYPLSKYDTVKEKRLEERYDEQMEEGNEKEDGTTKKAAKKSINKILARLPKYAHIKAKKIFPFVTNLNYGDLDLTNLMYDLVATGAKNLRTQNHELLSSVIRQLNDNPQIDKRWFINKLDTYDIPKTHTDREGAGVIQQQAKKSKRKTLKQLQKHYFTKKAIWH